MDKDALSHDIQAKNKRVLRSVFLIVFVMLGLAFASVPLYDLFCRVTGFDGTTQVAEALPDTVLDRRVTVKFNADIHANLHWSFAPEQREISLQSHSLPQNRSSWLCRP